MAFHSLQSNESHVQVNFCQLFITYKHFEVFVPQTNKMQIAQIICSDNMLSALFKNLEGNYYNQYLKANMNNIKNP